MTTIEVFEPRYHDMTVLLAKYRLPANADVYVKISKGAYKGKYLVTASDIAKAKDDMMMSKSGHPIGLKAIPIAALRRVDE